MFSLQHLPQMNDQRATAPWQAPHTTARPPSEWAGHHDSISNAHEPASTVELRDKRTSPRQKSHALARHVPHPSPEAQHPDTRICVDSANLAAVHGLTVTAEILATPTRIPTPILVSPNSPNTTTLTPTHTPVLPISPAQAGAGVDTNHQPLSTKKMNTAATYATANPSKTAPSSYSAPHPVPPAPVLHLHKASNTDVLAHRHGSLDERTRAGQRCGGSGQRCMRQMISGIS